MCEAEVKHSLIGHNEPMREGMQTPEDVALMLHLALAKVGEQSALRCSWGVRRIR